MDLFSFFFHPDGRVNLLAQVRKTLLFRALFVKVRNKRKLKVATTISQAEGIVFTVNTLPYYGVVSFWDSELSARFSGI